MIAPIVDRDLPGALSQINASFARLKLILQ
jgi:hypothetical protein